ncbi:MAG: hypothetical protein KDE35_02235 [Geminicoccaceae bacterium]|nr:hypothetical protein [Geminicoccaceae bacterium]
MGRSGESGKKRDTGRDNKGVAPSDAAFDRWLDRQMHELYDDALAEELPDELSELLDRFESRDGSKGRKEGETPEMNGREARLGRSSSSSRGRVSRLSTKRAKS